MWWLRPWWRGRGSASEVRAATIGRPPRAAAASTIGATSSAVVPRVDAVPTTPGPMATMTTSAPATRTREVDRGRRGDRLEVAPERLAGRDRDVEQRPRPAARPPGRRGRAAARRRRSSRRRRGAPGSQRLERPRPRRRPGCAARRPRPARPSRSGRAVDGAVLLGRAGVGLQARVAELHDVAAARARPARRRLRFQWTTCQPPVPRPSSTAVVLTTTSSPTATGPVRPVRT